ncbi:hypothetical protein JQ596_21170 [Bradyrhizobium manausense]|uniref:hypothetical protein n=1 Tax=Bradyrhizobium TaxID=374 RepID=UPI001BA5DC9D|nr:MULTISPECIES: hypothetical protein [Bradyrhizobium]MBR0828049.1 hypothetical protein [Bradyrhizobium manausense]UVO32911.1 hypothetical protein KUF59_20975 [Bradyrhizobium arachidis]
MSDSNPFATTGSQQRSSDIQQLAGLLGNLMPLLMRLQSQGFEQSFRTMPGNFPIPNPVLDHQASENMIGDMLAATLRSLSAYLEANAAQYAGLEHCGPTVTQAANRLAERDYAQAFNLIWLSYRAIETLRAADPRLPLPQRASIDQTQSSVH